MFNNDNVVVGLISTLKSKVNGIKTFALRFFRLLKRSSHYCYFMAFQVKIPFWTFIVFKSVFLNRFSDSKMWSTSWLRINRIDYSKMKSKFLVLWIYQFVG